jgi:predicted RNA polymerase sigma factor
MVVLLLLLRRAARATVEGLLRALAPQVLDALVRRYGQFDLSEDAVQEALLAATRWPTEGVPDNPRGWLTTVAGRRLVDQIRSEQARRRREDAVPPGSRIGRRPAPARTPGPTGTTR